MTDEANRYVPPVQEDGLRHWRVAGGVIVTGSTVLLVKNQRRGGAIDWSTPGGVIDPGETLLEALTREVREETGQLVAMWEGPLYRVVVQAPDAGFRLEVEAHLGSQVAGELVVDDPDGIVIDAGYVERAVVGDHLVDSPRWVSEPLLAHLHDGVADGREFRYQLTGGLGPDRQVVRL
jgi:8-oxo-dGTP diphosphatase